MTESRRTRNNTGRRAAFVLAVLFALAIAAAAGTGLEFRGQLSFWLGGHDRPAAEGAAGLRYVPSFSLKHDPGSGWSVDAEVSVNAYGSAQGGSLAGLGTSGAFKAYRMWARLATSRFEARLGLQKINFGSALLLRPLMWFDRVDPNDPLQMTDGVKALLLKYTFADNTNVWLWGLYGNDETKGWEIAPTRRGAPEFGGRLQIPFGPGEVAVSYHHRRLDAERSLVAPPAGEAAAVPEDRLGLDGKWDLGLGLWFEAVWTRQGWIAASWRDQRAVTAGLDFTFGLGNGLHVLAEHMAADFGAALGPNARRNLTALAADYPLGVLDRLKAVVYRDWTTNDFYRLLTWQRTYDKWSFSLIGFWNPDRYQIPGAPRGTNLFAGRGAQIMIIYNH